MKAIVHTQPQGEPDDQIITVTSDGPMQMNQATMYAVFNIHVIAVEASTGRELHCDKMEIWFNQATKKIKKAICTGHVKAIQGPDVSYADQMIYDGETQVLTMIGRPKIVFDAGSGKGNGMFQPLRERHNMRLLEAKNLVKIYGGRRVVDGLSITVGRSEIVGLLGPNGAGKTTSFYMVVGIISS